MINRHLRCLLAIMGLIACTIGLHGQTTRMPVNIVFILSDDHRYDAMGFMGKIPWLETPNLDQMAARGAHVKNAFVTTALCSPSRASILTGMYSHSHTIVDNTAPEPPNLTYFPQLLQQGGYKTAFFGKWHMGDEDDKPRKGFDHWEGLRGQGVYFGPTLNIDGAQKKFPDSTYITDLLTRDAIAWMKKQPKDQPFMVYLSHKGVHAEFMPAKRHDGRYKDKPIIYPPSYNQTKSDDYKRNGWPDWVKAQRYSWHGVDYMYHGQMDFETFFRKYCETLLSIDESVGAVNAYLKAAGLDENTLVVYMGDNGFSFGEHGLIDKRQAYEESMRVPLLMQLPSQIKAGMKLEAVVQNIDLAPTFLEFAGLKTPSSMHGISFAPVLRGEASDKHRDQIFYEYYWEYAFPQTPTMFAVRTSRYKYIHYYGIWDSNELYDLQNDPNELHNLIANPALQPVIQDLSKQLFDWLESTGGMKIPLKRNDRPKIDHKYKDEY